MTNSTKKSQQTPATVIWRNSQLSLKTTFSTMFLRLLLFQSVSFVLRFGVVVILIGVIIVLFRFIYSNVSPFSLQK